VIQKKLSPFSFHWQLKQLGRYQPRLWKTSWRCNITWFQVGTLFEGRPNKARLALKSPWFAWVRPECGTSQSRPI